MSNIELLIVMLNAQSSYSLQKIHKKDRDIFDRTMKEIIKNVSLASSIDDVQNILLSLSPLLKEDNFFKRAYHNSLPAREFAFKVTEDAAQSIRVRFVDGGSKIYEGIISEVFKK